MLSPVLRSPIVSLRGSAGLTPPQLRLNTRMAKLRVSSEWMFKDVTSLWPLLSFHKGLKLRQMPVSKFYVLAADLTNMHTIMRGRCQTSLYFQCPPPSMEEYLAPRDYIRVQNTVGTPAAVRAMIKREVQAAPVKLEPVPTRAEIEARDDVIQACVNDFANNEDDSADAGMNRLVNYMGRLRLDCLQAMRAVQEAAAVADGGSIAAGFATV